MAQSAKTPTPSPAPQDIVGVREVADIEEQSYEVIQSLRNRVFEPDHTKRLKRRFAPAEAASLVGRKAGSIRAAERAGRLPEPPRDARGRRSGYTLVDLNRMREEFGTRPWRDPAVDAPVHLAIQSFKGGVGKSTLAAHISQYLALQGYRVCVVDCDPQASLTALFGFHPDYDVHPDQTLAPYLAGERASLDYAVRETYWDQLHIIPANLDLYNVEYQLAARLPSNPRALERLRSGLEALGERFDVVIIDPPPALGMISLSVLRAANAMIVPVRPATLDFASTAHFFTMLRETMEKLTELGMETRFRFLKIVANDMDEGKSAHVAITHMMQRLYKDTMLTTVMRDSAEIDNASAALMTVFELERPITSREVHRRCVNYLVGVNREIELLIRKTWPSHRERLRAQGLL